MYGEGRLGLTIQEQYEKFHEENPWVLRALERAADEWFAAGHQRCSIKMLWESMRYRHGVTTGKPYRFPNNVTSRYARALMQHRPEWRGKFVTATLRAV
ncbi:hypothetical protein [Streptomyces sp. NPDC050507]|uniref:hypothetical protein n=1 Tax=Streptomyces sp. NPDC050507 TaxID=3365619 RepID=UPI0037896A0B